MYTRRYVPEPSIVVELHAVTIEGMRVPRPSRIPPTEWLRYWGGSDLRPWQNP